MAEALTRKGEAAKAARAAAAREAAAEELPVPVFPEAALSADDLADPLKKAGRVAVAAALATTLSAGVAPDKVHLPDPTPIVHVIDFAADQPAPDQPADQATDQKSAWKKILKYAVMAVAALLMMGALLLGAVKGCAGTLALPFLHGDDDTPAAVDAATEDAASQPTGEDAASDVASAANAPAAA
ncbi:MAG: hypothetical protein IKD70_04150 [Eggerthellaceae bacterium]|nr:hypothetical protein [Eggerthellaceae bacterium]